MTDHDTTQSDLVADNLDRLTEALVSLLATDVTDPELRDVPNVVDAVYALTKAVREMTRAITAELSALAWAAQNRPAYGRPAYDFSDPGPATTPDRR
jgi:hypothetical protein